VSLPMSAIAALNAHRKRQDKFRHQFGPDYRADLDLIFANPDGTPLKPDSISAAVSLLFRRLKLPKGTSLHSLRHTHTSHLLASGVPLPAVSARLGHGSIRTTQEIYSHMIHGQDDEAAKRWEEFQGRSCQRSGPSFSRFQGFPCSHIANLSISRSAKSRSSRPHDEKTSLRLDAANSNQILASSCKSLRHASQTEVRFRSITPKFSAEQPPRRAIELFASPR
jgi:Phage integrase family